MDSEEQYGIDANFIVEVPDSLKCRVCHLVMRDPIQIMSCGHRFCSICFERVKGYSQHLNTELCCPVDRLAIDTNKVLTDVGMARDINSLQVMCYLHEEGCTWRGDLQDISQHKAECPYEEKVAQSHTSVQGKECDFGMLKELCQRLGKCEDTICDKEKDIAYLKFNLQEMKKQFTEKEMEIESLKVKNNKVEEKIKKIKEKELDVKQQLEIKIENLILKNQLLENKLASLEHQLLDSRKQFDAQREEIKLDKERAVKINTHPYVESKIQELSYTFQQLQTKLNNDVVAVNTQIEAMKMNMNGHDEMYGLNCNDQPPIVKCDDVVEKLRDDMKEVVKISEMNALKSHVLNIENVLFCNTMTDSKDIVIQWTLQNYQHHLQLGKTVFSPTFFTEVSGFSFRLEIKWSGDNKGTLGLYFKLCRGCEFESDLGDFNMEIMLQIHDMKGNKVSKKIGSKTINANRAENFSILPGKKAAKFARGFKNFLTMPELQNYIINDMLWCRCILTPFF